MAQQKRLAIVNRKGGVGKTTTAVNVAHGLALLGNSVLLIDLDPQGHCAIMLGVDPDGMCISNVLGEQSDVVDNIVETGRDGLYLLPSSDNLRDAEVYLQRKFALDSAMGDSKFGKAAIDPDSILSYYLNDSVDVFDYIILDCPPTLTPSLNAVYEFADSAVVTVTADYMGTVATGHHTTNIVAEQTKGININIAAIVLTIHEPHMKLNQSMVEHIKANYPKHIIAQPIPKRQAVREATAFGQTLFEYDPAGDATKAYEMLVNRLR